MSDHFDSNEELVIFAVDQCVNEHNDINMDDVFIEYAHHLGYNVTSLRGFYKGEIERSYAMYAPDFFRINAGHMFVANQESVLHVGSAFSGRAATLMYKQGRCEAVGTFKQVSYDDALKCDGWTQSITENRWYICEEE